MKVLVVVDGIWPPAVEMSGIKAVYELQKELAALGLEIFILTSIEKWTVPEWKSWFEDQKEKYRINFFYIDNSIKNFPRLYFYLTRILFFFKAWQLCRKEKFDIIHEYSSSPVLINRTWLLGKLTGVKTYHTICTHNIGAFGSYRLIFGKIDKVICTTKKMLSELKAHSAQSTTYLPLGINIKKFLSSRYKRDYRKELHIPIRSPIILYLGLFDRRKGIFTFLKAIPKVLKKHPRAVFIIATSGQKGNFYDYQNNKKKVLPAVDSHKENIRFLEGKQDVVALMNATDIFVYPLTTMHGILGVPITLIEALACGKAIIASDLEELKEFIEDRINALVLHDEKELVKGIDELFRRSLLKQKLEKNAVNSAKEYDIMNISKDLKNIYKSLPDSICLDCQR